MEDRSLLTPSITAIGISLSPITFPCESVGGPGKSNLLDFFTGCCLGQYSIVRLARDEDEDDELAACLDCDSDFNRLPICLVSLNVS